MLWRQDQKWVGRGSTGRGTENILKYKPTVLTVGIPYEPAYNVLQTTAVKRERNPLAGGDDDDLYGYHVRLRWKDPIHIVHAYCIICMNMTDITHGL